MLVLQRSIGESVLLFNEKMEPIGEITLINYLGRGVMKIGIALPKNIIILREELLNNKRKKNGIN